MSEDVGALVARVVADTEQFRSDMVRTAKALESNTARMNKALASINKSTGGLQGSLALVTRGLGALGIALSVRGMVGFVTQTIRAGAELHNMSERLNISVEALSELQYVAKIADVDFQTLGKSMQFMTRTIGEAMLGTKAAKEVFADLGVDFRAIAGLPVDRQLETIAEALSRVKEETVRTALAQQVFSRGGIEMLQITNRGAEGIRKMTQEAHDLGVVMSTETAAAFDRYDDELAKYGARWDAFWTRQTVQAGQWFDFQMLGLKELGVALKMLPGSLAQKPNAPASGTDADLMARFFAFSKSDAGRAALSGAVGGAKGAGVVGLLPPPSSQEDPLTGITSLGGARKLPPAEINESIKASEKELTDFIKQQNIERQQSWIDAWNENMAIAKEAADREIEIRASVANVAVGFLQAVGSKHRGAAIAALAIQKALAIKEILIQSQVAAARALAELGPIAGSAMAARILIMGKISAGLVAATGLVEAAQVSSGGTQSTLGTSANPIATRDGSSGAANTIAASRNQKVVELHIHGNVYGAGGVRKIIQDIRDEIDDADVILIGPDSRQAAMLSG